MSGILNNASPTRASVASRRTGALRRAVLLALWLPVCAWAQVLSEGMALPALVLPDQQGANLSAVEGTRILLFAPDRDSARIVHEVLRQIDPALLEARGVRYVTDISGMPGVVTELFALPAMREYPYRVLLGYEANDTATLPRREAQVTVLDVRDGRIERTRFADSAAALAAAAELTPE